MQEAQKQLDQLDPQTKGMMDSMGIHMDAQKISKDASVISKEQTAKAWDDETRLTPQRDAARIAAISKVPLSASTLPVFISRTNHFVLSKLSGNAKALGEKIYEQLKSAGKTADLIGNTATVLWLIGRVETALCIMAKACSDDATITDNLNNYAAMLSMSGAEQFAVPLLNRVNGAFPKNPTVLNNLGQAWFGLGEINLADRYFDTTIRIYAGHAQANYTKSFIEEERGNIPKAVALVKASIKSSFTQEKDARLSKLGYEINSNDLDSRFKPEPDPLAMGLFKHPAFPVDAEQEITLKKEWDAFRREIEMKQVRLMKQLTQAAEAWKNSASARQEHDYNVVKTTSTAGATTGQLTALPLYLKRGTLQLKEMDKDGGMTYRYEQALQKMALHPQEHNGLWVQYQHDIARVREEDDEQTGEGKPNKEYCPKYVEVINKYLGDYNSGLEIRYDDYLKQLRLKLSEETYWKQYTEYPEEFEVTKISNQVLWLGALKDIRYGETEFFENRPYCSAIPPGSGNGKLANFNDLHCAYHSKLDLGFGSIQSDCNKMTTQFAMGILKLGLTQDMDKETFKDQFVSCNVEVTGKVGSSVKMGPVSAGIEASAGIGIEIGRNGIEDVYITGKAGAGVGTNVIEGLGEKGTPTSMGGVGVNDRSVDVGVEGRVSLVSGKSSVSGSGILGH